MQRQRESKNCNSLTRQNNNFACVSSITLFCTFLCCHCTTTTWKCLISRFVKNVSKQWQNFLLFMNFDMFDRNSAPEEFACIWQSKRVGIITIETKKMWIHFSSSSLYFWKSIFSFWVDSILKRRVYIKLKVSWLPAFLWCMSQKSRDRVSSRRVETHEKNWGDAVHRLGTIIQSIFVPNQKPALVWPFRNGLVRVSTQGLFRLCLKTFVALFLPAQLTTPGSPRMP